MIKKILIAVGCLFAITGPMTIEAYNGPSVEWAINTDNIPDAGFTLPIHGNWCGPGHGGKEAYSPKPTDRLDYGCMKHDLCYMNNGYFNAKCDKELLTYIENNKKYMKGKEWDAANVVYATFAFSKLRKNP